MPRNFLFVLDMLVILGMAAGIYFQCGRRNYVGWTVDDISCSADRATGPGDRMTLTLRPTPEEPCQVILRRVP